jgi:hypothetical protein
MTAKDPAKLDLPQFSRFGLIFVHRGIESDRRIVAKFQHKKAAGCSGSARASCCRSLRF